MLHAYDEIHGAAEHMEAWAAELTASLDEHADLGGDPQSMPGRYSPRTPRRSSPGIRELFSQDAADEFAAPWSRHVEQMLNVATALCDDDQAAEDEDPFAPTPVGTRSRRPSWRKPPSPTWRA